MKANTISNETCETTDCYCPDIGLCQTLGYSIPLNQLVANNTHVADHNRNYYFWIKSRNNAGLTNIEYLDILVDYSPPETGVIFEGYDGNPEIDYTSDNDLPVHWHGFIDHESGIMMYRVALAEHCLSTESILSENKNDSIIEVKEVIGRETSVTFKANFTGKYYASVIAINNAATASKAACSDGVVRDLSPPEFRNVKILNAKHSESVICDDKEPYLFTKDLQIIALNENERCLGICKHAYDPSDLVRVFPIQNQNTSDQNIHEFICDKTPLYTNEAPISIPNDQFQITWDMQEDESQIENYFIGFGDDAENTTHPSILDYKPTYGKRFFHKSHLGISSGERFFVSLKALSKSKSERTQIIGPFIIDETPPEVRTHPVVTISENHITMGWTNNSFYEPDQENNIDQIFFKIECNGKAISPFYEWSREDSEPCSAYSGGCIRYPLKSLQSFDTDQSLGFRFRLHVYNNAGHYAEKHIQTHFKFHQSIHLGKPSSLTLIHCTKIQRMT
ncbi:uncharacterized protein LOC128224186 [Mya arenaria]|uniref:uncharacterized protein LOC128224186 n=1 Tax=Mya arenaria TaxID=6604 RepID=UPI0022E9457C|nr:uncharacterized protein LOC128224186 [Mya arenaria]